MTFFWRVGREYSSLPDSLLLVLQLKRVDRGISPMASLPQLLGQIRIGGFESNRARTHHTLSLSTLSREANWKP